jgi:hypothetical protein
VIGQMTMQGRADAVKQDAAGRDFARLHVDGRLAGVREVEIDIGRDQLRVVVALPQIVDRQSGRRCRVAAPCRSPCLSRPVVRRVRAHERQRLQVRVPVRSIVGPQRPSTISPRLVVRDAHVAQREFAAAVRDLAAAPQGAPEQRARERP